MDGGNNKENTNKRKSTSGQGSDTDSEDEVEYERSRMAKRICREMADQTGDNEKFKKTFFEMSDINLKNMEAATINLVIVFEPATVYPEDEDDMEIDLIMMLADPDNADLSDYENDSDEDTESTEEVTLKVREKDEGDYY